MSLTRLGLFLSTSASAALLCIGTAWGKPVELSEQELAAVCGQGLVTLANSSLNGLDFSTITLNADVTMSANFKNIVLGQYTATANNGSGADINIPLLQFGRSDGATAQKVVQITNPYVEFIYNNAAGAGNSQVVGMRFGFEGIAGDVGLLMSSISGSLQIDGGAAGILSSNGQRSASACATPTSCLALSLIGGVTAGNTTGASRDFWISVLSKPVQFAAQAGLSQPNIAQAGVWLNWTDRLTALNTSGVPPPNVAYALRRH
jgi:hypothetical protein